MKGALLLLPLLVLSFVFLQARRPGLPVLLGRAGLFGARFPWLLLRRARRLVQNDVPLEYDEANLDQHGYDHRAWEFVVLDGTLNVVLVVVRDPGVEQEDEEQDEHLNKHGARVEVHARFLVVEAPDFLEKAVFVFGEKELRLVFDVLLELVPNQIE